MGYLFCCCAHKIKVWLLPTSKSCIRNIVIIFQTTILRFVGFYVRHLAMILQKWFHSFTFAPLSCWGFIVTLVCTQRFDRKSTFTDVLTSIFLKKRTPSKWWEMASITYLLMFLYDIQIPLDIIPCLVWNTVSFHFIFTILIFVL